MDKAKKYIQEGITSRKSLDTVKLNKVANIIIKAFRKGNKVLVFGNGGSAADAHHIAAEFMGMQEIRRSPLPAISLTDNISNMTSIPNDYSWESVFSRQIEGIGKNGDIAIAISTSGNSKNVLEATIKAKSMGIYVIGLAGNNGGLLAKIANEAIIINSKRTPIIQETYMAAAHVICSIVEETLFQTTKTGPK